MRLLPINSIFALYIEFLVQLMKESQILAHVQLKAFMFNLISILFILKAEKHEHEKENYLRKLITLRFFYTFFLLPLMHLSVNVMN